VPLHAARSLPQPPSHSRRTDSPVSVSGGRAGDGVLQSFVLPRLRRVSPALGPALHQPFAAAPLTSNSRSRRLGLRASRRGPRRIRFISSSGAGPSCPHDGGPGPSRSKSSFCLGCGNRASFFRRYGWFSTARWRRGSSLAHTPQPGLKSLRAVTIFTSFILFTAKFVNLEVVFMGF
jgi:hypothetical protein